MSLPSARRGSPVYRLTAVKGEPEPPAGARVHFVRPDTTAECRISLCFRLKTRARNKVTCPACLNLMREKTHGE